MTEGDDLFMNLINIEIEQSVESSKSIEKRAKKQPTNETTCRKKKPRGGYRPMLVNEADLGRESIELEHDMKLINETNANSMSVQDIVSYYVIVYVNYRYPNNFLENKHEIIIDKSTITSMRISDLPFKFKNKSLENRLRNTNTLTLFDLINTFNLHSVPYSARCTLANWYLGNKFDLVLFLNKIPSSRQVLKLQANGRRCVTLISNKIDCAVLGERDPFSFLLHDLVHAYKMFSNDYLLKGQIGFYNALLKLYLDLDDNLEADLDSLLKRDERFTDEFDYLISDMNSHPRHLFYYFKAILINAVKRKFNLNDHQRLDGPSLDEFNRLFNLILNRFNMNDLEKSLSNKLIFDDQKQTTGNVSMKPSILNDFTVLDNFFLNFV